MSRPFAQVDVFGSGPCAGNPVAVVLEAEDLSAKEMQRFARWTNLAETTFVLPPTRPEADYRVRIFTPVLELPFAGHPTLGTCHAWLEAGGGPGRAGEIVQECEAGLIRIRAGTGGGFAFEAPPMVRSGQASEEEAAKVAAALGVEVGEMLAVEWADNGPGWIVAMFESAERVLKLQPGRLDFDLGVVGFHPPGSPAAIELRAFAPVNGLAFEDPVTGSLNASVAQWLLGNGRLQAPYVATQGGAIDRAGRIEISQDPDGAIWVGGRTETVIEGTAKPQ
jgi:PhzF family phenazine biosynthesis protein